MSARARALAVAIIAAALLPVVSWAESSQDTESHFLAGGVLEFDESPTFGGIQNTSHLELFGDVHDVPTIVNTIRSFGSRGDERRPPVIVFINWRG